MRRTKAGLILEKILGGLKHRYLLCWNGETSECAAYDCACCLTWTDEEMYRQCGCVCHKRIEEMATESPNIYLWLVAMDAMGELPVFYTSYEHKLQHSREVKANHEKHQIENYLCPCEECEFVRKHDAEPPTWYKEQQEAKPEDYLEKL